MTPAEKGRFDKLGEARSQSLSCLSPRLINRPRIAWYGTVTSDLSSFMGGLGKAGNNDAISDSATPRGYPCSGFARCW